MEVMHAASDSRQSFRDADGQAAIVFDVTRLRQADPALFDPASYGEDAEPVTGSGGRGSAWFVRGEFGAGVLRHYRRGGWAARASQDSYLWHGEDKARSFAEFRLLQALRKLGLPVPAPIAAYYRRRDWRYRAAILIGRIDDARSFATAVAADPEAAPWTSVGLTIARFHRSRARHADLNANNILLDRGDQAWLIDWDKGELGAPPGAWCQRVLARLQRSLRKECKLLSGEQLTAGMDRLRSAHDAVLGP